MCRRISTSHNFTSQPNGRSVPFNLGTKPNDPKDKDEFAQILGSTDKRSRMLRLRMTMKFQGNILLSESLHRLG